MYTENIIRSLEDLIHDVRQAGGRAYENKRDADRTFTRVREGEEGTLDGYETVSEGLEDASEALDKAKDDFGNIEEMLNKIIEDIKMEELSAKVQSK
jgi:chromosome segregation ATPase